LTGLLLALACAGAPAAPPEPGTVVAPAAAPPRQQPDPIDPFAQAQPPLPTIPLTLGDDTVTAEVADSRTERSVGLMHRTALPAGAGMLFVYPDERRLSFWMRNTLVPLSIAFINAQGTIVRISDMKPLDERHVPSDWPAMYALEVPQGWFVARGVAVGDTVVGLPGPAPE
jgi:uncharacterized membrane protein (UPF0127 family)